MTRRMTYVCVLRKLSSYFHFTSMFCMRTDLELLKRMFQTACHNSDFITVLKLAKYATVFASFLLSDLVQTLHTFSTHHYLWSFPFFLWISKYFFRKTEVFYVFFLWFWISVPSCCVIRLKLYTHFLFVIKQGLFFFFTFPHIFRQNLGKLRFFSSHFWTLFFPMLFATLQSLDLVESLHTSSTSSNHQSLEYIF